MSKQKSEINVAADSKVVTFVAKATESTLKGVDKTKAAAKASQKGLKSFWQNVKLGFAQGKKRAGR